MKPMKQQSDDINYDYNDTKRKKLDDDRMIISNVNKSSSLTYFEDLSNEIIYEIFNFLDIYHIYQAFIHVNQRFEKLLIDSTFLIKINMLSMSKSNFQYYYSNIIIPNKNRIISLVLSNLFIIDNILSSIHIASIFTRLERLILNNIEAKHLENILNYGLCLSKLYSLIIDTIDPVENSNYFYRKIFKLSRLKYCKVSLETDPNIESLPMSNDELSSIEYLIIENTVYFDVLDRLLSYVPALRHLKFRYLDGCNCKRRQLYPITLNYLSHISLEFVFIYFNQFEKLIKDTFHQVQFLHISTEDDVTYLDGNRWEQLILSSMPNLLVFQLNHSNSLLKNTDRTLLSYDDLIKKFTSSFWNERQCTFTHRKDWICNIDIEIFFSTHPHKKKYNNMFKLKDAITYSSDQEINLNSVKHIYICCTRALNNCINYFSNVTDVTIDCQVNSHNKSITTTLDQIIPLSRITKLIIASHSFSLIQLIELLFVTPNIHTLVLDFISIDDTEYTLIEQSQSFQYVSSTNIIKHIILNKKCTLEKLKILVGLCPRSENLAIVIDKNNLKPIIRLLLSQTIAHQLFLLCIPEIPKLYLEEINRLIKLEKLLHDYLIKFIDGNLYLWW